MPVYQGRSYRMEKRNERFFYTKSYPHHWSGGPTVIHSNEKFDDINSLEEAKALAEQFAVDSYNEDRCVTTYGVEYGEFYDRPVWDDDPVELKKEVKMANKIRIDQLQAGQEVTLKFHGSKSIGNEPYEETHTFLGIVGEKDDRRAVFSDGSTQWEAYRYNGGWAYGSSAERLSLVSVN